MSHGNLQITDAFKQYAFPISICWDCGPGASTSSDDSDDSDLADAFLRDAEEGATWLDGITIKRFKSIPLYPS